MFATKVSVEKRMRFVKENRKKARLTVGVKMGVNCVRVYIHAVCELARTHTQLQRDYTGTKMKKNIF